MSYEKNISPWRSQRQQRRRRTQVTNILASATWLCQRGRREKQGCGQRTPLRVQAAVLLSQTADDLSEDDEAGGDEGDWGEDQQQVSGGIVRHVSRGGGRQASEESRTDWMR